MYNNDYYIIGINFGSHNSSIAIYHNNEIIYVAEEERFNKEKHTKKLPLKSLEYAVEKYSLDSSDKKIDIVYFMNPWLGFLAIPKMLKFYPNITTIKYGFQKAYKRLQEWRLIKKLAEEKSWNAYWANHHDAHAASTFYLSPFKQATILTIDGRGEYLSIAIYEGNEKNINYIKGISIPYSIGYLYSKFTEFLGFVPQFDEYKIMGLSSYGTPIYLKKFENLFNIGDNFNLKINVKKLNYWGNSNQNNALLLDDFGLPRNKEDEINQNHKDIASSLQKHTENLILKLVKQAIQATGHNNLCIAGGVALNCLANSKIALLEEVDDIFIPPAPNDAGTSLGATLIHARKQGKLFNSKVKYSPFLGPIYTEKDIDKAIKKYRMNISYIKLNDPEIKAAELLNNGKIIGWFQDNMEWGPRALGNRSILAPAHPIEIKERINSVIKFRELFRPFAPIILEEDFKYFFKENKKSYKLFKFMLSTATANKNTIFKIPASVHVDNTARVQIIDKVSRPKIYKLLIRYKELSGIGVLINTSFNVKGKPIVLTPQDAIEHMLDSKLDACIIQNYLITKNEK